MVQKPHMSDIYLTKIRQNISKWILDCAQLDLDLISKNKKRGKKTRVHVGSKKLHFFMIDICHVFWNVT